MISTHTKDFSWEKCPKFARSYFKNSKSPEHYDNFQRVAKDIEGFCFFFLPSYILCSQIWLNYFLDDRYFGDYITKSLKETLLQPWGMLWGCPCPGALAYTQRTSRIFSRCMWGEHYLSRTLPIEDGTLCIRYFEEPYSKMSSFFPNKIIAVLLKEPNDTNSLSQVRTKDLRPHAGLHSQNGLILGPSYPTLKQKTST
jgi:hypothetical protein